MNKHITLVKKIAEGNFGPYSVEASRIFLGTSSTEPAEFIRQLYTQIYPVQEFPTTPPEGNNRESFISTFGADIVDEITELGKQ